MAHNRLMLEDEVLVDYGAGIDALPVTLFPEPLSERASSGVPEVRARLEALLGDPAWGEAFVERVVMLSAIAPASSLIQPTERVAAPRGPGFLAMAREHGPLGLTRTALALDLDALAELSAAKVSMRPRRWAKELIRVLELAQVQWALAGAPDGARLHLEIDASGEALRAQLDASRPEDADITWWAGALLEALREALAASTDAPGVGGPEGADAVEARAERWPRPEEARGFERWPTLGALPEGDWVGDAVARVLALAPELAPEHPSWGALTEAIRAQPEAARERATRALLWRAPGPVSATLSSPTRYADTLADALAEAGPGWRARAVARARRELDAGRVTGAFALLRAACDVDIPGDDLTEAMRRLLRDTYGRPLPSEGLGRSHFLLPPESERAPATPAEDHRDLTRLLHDGCLGALLEPGLEEGPVREAFFAEHIARPLGYLDHHPTAEGRREKIRENPELSGGPSLVSVVLFLIGLAFALTAIGVILA